MKIKEGKVKVDEIDLGFCLIHILYIVFSMWLHNYFWCLFIYYEQNMVCFLI
jgi:hypothetical protein